MYCCTEDKSTRIKSIKHEYSCAHSVSENYLELRSPVPMHYPHCMVSFADVRISSPKAFGLLYEFIFKNVTHVVNQFLAIRIATDVRIFHVACLKHLYFAYLSVFLTRACASIQSGLRKVEYS